MPSVVIILCLLAAFVPLVSTYYKSSNSNNLDSTRPDEPNNHATSVTNPIILENQKPGTTSWKSPNFGSYGLHQRGDQRRPTVVSDADAGGGLTSSVAWTDTQQVSGYADQTSINKGESIGLHISSKAATYRLQVYRVGWYGGAGASLILTVNNLPGTNYPIPTAQPNTYLIEANWPVAYTLQTDASWTTGLYLVSMNPTSSPDILSYIIFVVRDDSSTADILYQLPTATYQAYNGWGGHSLYEFSSDNGQRGYAVSYSRPYEYGDGAGDLWPGDYNMILWLEREGYNVSYATSEDTATNPNLMANHKMFLTTFHDEYWSMSARNNITVARDQGKDLAFFTANNIYWQIRYAPSGTGIPNRTIICWKEAILDPMSTGATPELTTVQFRDPPVNMPENALLGAMFDNFFDYGDSVPWVVVNSSHWIYANTGVHDGDQIATLVGYEYDRVWDNGHTPPDIQIISTSPVVKPQYNINSIMQATIYTTPGNAMVFNASTMYWSFLLLGWNDEILWPVDARVQQMTRNLLNAMISGAPPTDLIVTKSNNVSGAVSYATPWNWKLTVTNSGGQKAAFANNNTILVDDLPNTNITYGQPTITDSVGLTGTVSCTINAFKKLICKASGAVTIAEGTGSFSVEVSATPTDPGSFTNPRNGGSCAVDPTGKVTEGNESNNTCSVNTVTVTDTTPPVITVPGNNPVTVQLNTTYTDAGATASDDVDGNLTGAIVVTNPVNTAVPDTYTVTYHVTDSSGNAATAYRTVRVMDTFTGNLAFNGDFSNGETSWNFYNIPQHMVQNGVLNTNANGGNAVFQYTGASASAGEALQLTLDLNNTDAVTGSKNVKVVLHNDAWTDWFVCDFILPGNNPGLTTQTLRMTTATVWNNIGVDIYDYTTSGWAWMQIDNVKVTRAGIHPHGSPPCEGTGAVQNTNLMLNSSFISPFTNQADSWNFFGIASQNTTGGVLNYQAALNSPNAVYQLTGKSIPTGAPLVLTLQLNNTSPTSKIVGVVLHNHTWTEYRNCVFLVPGGNPGLTTYTVRDTTASMWGNTSVDIYDWTRDGQGFLQLDNVNLQWQPGADTSLHCQSPTAPANTNMVRNGTFNTDDSEWFFYNIGDRNVSGGVLNFNASAGGNAVYQPSGRSIPGNAPVQATLQLNNTSPSSKNFRVVIHDELWGDYFLCGFTVPGNNPGLQTYTIRGRTNRVWGNAYIDLYDDTASGQPYARLDNVNIQYQPALGVTTTECIAPAPLVVSAEVPEQVTPVDDVSLDATRIAQRPTPEATEEVNDEPSLNADAGQPSQREMAAVVATPIPTQIPTEAVVEPAASVQPPILETMDDGTANWIASGSWILTGDADSDGVGAGWQASAGVEPATLTLNPMLDLRSVSNPALSFQTLVVSAYSSASVEVSFDGVAWQPISFLSPTPDWQTVDIDLHPYRGQMIYLRFVWLSRLPQPGDPGVDMWLLDEVQVENIPTPTIAPTEIPPAATSVPTAVPTVKPTETPASEPTAQPAPTEAIPAEEVPLDAEPPSR